MVLFPLSLKYIQFYRSLKIFIPLVADMRRDFIQILHKMEKEMVQLSFAHFQWTDIYCPIPMLQRTEEIFMSVMSI